MITFGTLEVHVFGPDREPLLGARVRVEGGGEARETGAGRFVIEQAPLGAATVRVEADGLAPEERAVTVGRGRQEAVFILAPAGAPFYRRRGVRVPFSPPPGLVGVAVRGANRGTRDERTAADALASALAPALERVGAQQVETTRRGLALLRVEPERAAAAVRELRGAPGVRAAGPVAYQRGRDAAFFSGDIVVRTRPGVGRDAVEAIAQAAGCGVRRKLALADFWLLASPEGDLAAFLEQCEQLGRRPEVASAEPDLAFTLEPDAITPTDELVDEQWHVPLVGLPDAWQHLRDANPAGVTPGSADDRTFGRANVIIAVLDSGVPSTTDGGGNVTPTHPEFQGTVSDGQPKMAGFFDFDAMAANNANPDGDHGIQCAGVAAAAAGNASPAAGEQEGVAGAAPNCRVLAVQYPNPSTETEFADIYLWMAGLDPESDDPAFPPVLAQGAAVITNSAGGLNPAVFPVSALMDATFERLTDEGRGGRGTLLCFSAGNANTEFAAQRPWANHERTLGIAASNENEVRASYSNFGDGIDVCAPSSDEGVGLRGVTTTAIPGEGDLAGHTGGGSDYTAHFGGTSSATPFTAGVAALMLSMDPTLTWQEVRDILYNTAVKIDYANADPVGRWRDVDGDGVAEYSNWYGFGRIDAARAVCVAQTSIAFDTPTVAFVDVPEEEPTLRAIAFTVRSFRHLTFRVVSGPTTTMGPADSFVLHAGNEATHAGNWTCTPSTARIWVRYTGTNAGDVAHGEAMVECVETGETFPVTLTANTIERPRAALVLALDRSGSMNDPAGDGRRKIDVLRDSAVVVPGLAFEDTGLGAVSWDTDADLAGATAVQDAGLEHIGAGRAALQAHVSGHTTNPAGLTAIGDAVVAAQSLLDAASPDYAVRAMVVLTDGNETESLYLSELPPGSIHGRVYAIGLGTAENIQPAALAQLAGGSDGYLLMTGTLSTDDYFLLTKYYQQILAGVTNTEIVVDPDGWIAPGRTVRLPFHVNETDWRVDAVLHTPFPQAVHYVLEAPDGQIIDPGALAAEPVSRYVVDRGLAYYRLSLPVSAVGAQDPARPWHALLRLDDHIFRRYLAQLERGQPAPTHVATPAAASTAAQAATQAAAHGLRYAFVVQARSAVTMRTDLLQTGLEPGAEAVVQVALTEYGQPVPPGARVAVEITRPNGTRATQAAAESDGATFATSFSLAAPGVYRVRVVAEGRTTRGSPWTREALRSAVAWRGGNGPLPGPTDEQRLCRLLECLRRTKALDEHRLREFGVDVAAVARCTCKGERRE